MKQLLAYAKNKDAQHLPAWQAFNRAEVNHGSVGIWHERYAVFAGGYENSYVSMPPLDWPVQGCQSRQLEACKAVGRLRVGKP